MKKLVTTIALVVAIGTLITLGAYIYMRTAMHGFSARAAPSSTETMLAAYAQSTAMPSSAEDLKNPVHFTPEVAHEVLAHFADHYAICHANNGSGQTMFSKGMYPDRLIFAAKPIR